MKIRLNFPFSSSQISYSLSIHLHLERETWGTQSFQLEAIMYSLEQPYLVVLYDCYII